MIEVVDSYGETCERRELEVCLLPPIPTTMELEKKTRLQDGEGRETFQVL